MSSSLRRLSAQELEAEAGAVLPTKEAGKRVTGSVTARSNGVAITRTFSRAIRR
jgi:hypothetical protein